MSFPQFPGAIRAVAALLSILGALTAAAQQIAPPPILTPAATPVVSPSPAVKTAATQVETQAADPGPDARIETLVFVRHGEKRDDDKGQLTDQGLNRALALPEVLLSKYGKPQYIFAPATTKKESGKGSGTPFSYVRPLMTIEPTAIRVGLPVETKFAFDEIGGLQSELAAPAYQRAVVFIAWEHYYLDELVKRLVGVFGGDMQTIPDWPKDDFDSIFVVRVRTEGGKRTATFEHDQEGLNGLSTEYPELKAQKPK